jgi:hypothetical protein
MAEERATHGPNIVLAAQLSDALCVAYHAFVEAHPGEVSPATATNGGLGGNGETPDHCPRARQPEGGGTGLVGCL